MEKIQTWYNFVLQQMAAESYLDGINLGIPTDVMRRLRLGNNQENFPEAGLTRMTDSQAQYFVDHFQIVDHLGNDDPRLASWGLAGTGFSATLMRNWETGEYTLSFRSTEYQNQSNGGDWERDGYNGADGAIGNTGFAFAQLAAMEQYYEEVVRPLVQATSGVLNVTGYSLGAHLATVFTEMHMGEVEHAYTFNAAGRGTYDATVGSLNDMIAYFRAVLADPNAATGELPRFEGDGILFKQAA